MDYPYWNAVSSDKDIHKVLREYHLGKITKGQAKRRIDASMKRHGGKPS